MLGFIDQMRSEGAQPGRASTQPQAPCEGNATETPLASAIGAA